MGSITDYIAIFVIIYSFWKGWEKNVSDLILGPVSLMVSLTGGLLFYAHQKSPVYSVIVAVILFFIMQLAISAFEKILSANKKPGTTATPPGPLEFFFSGLLNCFWGFFLFSVLLATIILFRFENVHMKQAQKDIRFSQVYNLLLDTSHNLLPKEPISETTLKEWTKPINVEEWSRIDKISPETSK